MAETEVKQEATSKRVVGVLAAHYYVQDIDSLTGKLARRLLRANQGQEIELPESEERRLDSLGALLPKGSKSQDAFAHADARRDAYRAQRGDMEALQRHQERLVRDGGIVNVDAPVEDNSATKLAEWMKENKPNVEDTVALAEGDPRKAEKVLEAERLATGDSPRAGVEQGLLKLVEG